MIRPALCVALSAALFSQASNASTHRQVGINVLLNSEPTPALLSELGKYGRVGEVMTAIDAVTMRTTEDQLAIVRALPFVIAANEDAIRKGGPIDTVDAQSFLGGINTWNLDAVDVTDLGSARTTTYDGSGVYVAVLDTGLLGTWRQYFPEQRIATEFATGFSGGGQDMGKVSEPPNQWEHDQNSHGTHVTSTIIGYSLDGLPVNGVAPASRVIPVKVLNQAGWGWSSVIARGIVYIAELKANGDLGDWPVVINMSLGGPSLDAVEQAAIDYAIEQGVIVVASAGNEGAAGMGYPGAYEPVISVASSGWRDQWQLGGDGLRGNWWNADDVEDPTEASSFYVSDFSGRELPGQELDVVAPGHWIVGPYQLQSGKTSYYFLSGTSMASPHAAGIAALMLDKSPDLLQDEVEGLLKASALDLAAGCAMVTQPTGASSEICWGNDATGEGVVTAERALDATF